jgi:hypothetical protein
MFFALLTLISALSISVTAAYFSIFGLTALFPATAIAVMIMGIVLEIGKIISAVWLHKNWHNVNVSKILRTYMISAIVVLMLITDIGVFGFLSRGHLEAVSPMQGIQDKIDRIDDQIKTEQDIIDKANKQLKELDDSIDVYFKNDRVTLGLKARKEQEGERKLLGDTINKEQKKIDELKNQEMPLKEQMEAAATNIGPLKYVAQLFFSDYKNHIDTVVQIMICIIIGVFDPLAISLVIASTISMADYWRERKPSKPAEKTVEKIVKQQPKIEPKKEQKILEKISKSIYNIKHRHWGYGNPNKPKK